MPYDELHGNSQFYDAKSLLRPQHEEKTDAVSEFLHSAAYSGLQSPIEGVSQLVNKVSGREIVPQVHIVSAPKPAEFGSGNWHAQQLGGAVGMVAPFLLVNKAVGEVIGRPASAAEAAGLRYKVLQAGTSGFLYDSLMRPVTPDEGNFFAARFRHGAVSAITFSTLATAAHGLDAFGKVPPGTNPLSRGFSNQTFNHALSGVAAGTVNAQLESLTSGKGFASTEESMHGAYTFAVLGASLHGVEKGKEFVSGKVAEASARRELREDLRDVPVKASDGKVVDVYDKIMSQPDSVLRSDQKARIMHVLQEARTKFYEIDNSLPADHPDKGYQIVNWKHTRGEVDQVLEASKLSKEKMTPEQIEDAVLASIFSDSVKSPKNFITHHLDAARAAEEILPSYFDPAKPGNAARIKGIVESIKEHQIGPPGFMGFMSQMFIRNSIKGELTAGATKTFGEKLPEAESKLMDSITAKLTKPSAYAVDGKVPLTESEAAFMDSVGVARWKVEDSSEIDGIQQKISKPFENVAADKPGVVDFNQRQHDYLKLLRIEDWHVPNEKTDWYSSSRRVIDGDSLINYATPDGWAKIAQIRGPGTIFADKTIWDSLDSAKGSYKDAHSIISDAVKPLAEQGLARTEAAVRRVTPEMQKFVDANKEAYGYGPAEKVSFWDKDAEPLRYPEKGQTMEARDAMRLEFARKIRDQMVSQLRAQQGNYSER